jgi:predicted ArsR family transcriptional regulator
MMRAHQRDIRTIARRQFSVHSVHQHRRVWSYISVPEQSQQSIPALMRALGLTHYQVRSSLVVLARMGYIEQVHRRRGRTIVVPFRITPL